MGVGRLELPTSSLSGMRSNQLSYTPNEAQPLLLDRTGESIGREPGSTLAHRTLEERSAIEKIQNWSFKNGPVEMKMAPKIPQDGHPTCSSK